MDEKGNERPRGVLLQKKHLRGDFKNISIMLQDKSLITGNDMDCLFLPSILNEGPIRLSASPSTLVLPSFNTRGETG